MSYAEPAFSMAGAVMNINKHLILAVITGASFALSACANVQSSLGLNRHDIEPSIVDQSYTVTDISLPRDVSSNQFEILAIKIFEYNKKFAACSAILVAKTRLARMNAYDTAGSVVVHITAKPSGVVFNNVFAKDYVVTSEDGRVQDMHGKASACVYFDSDWPADGMYSMRVENFGPTTTIFVP